MNVHSIYYVSDKTWEFVIPAKEFLLDFQFLLTLSSNNILSELSGDRTIYLLDGATVAITEKEGTIEDEDTHLFTITVISKNEEDCRGIQLLLDQFYFEEVFPLQLHLLKEVGVNNTYRHHFQPNEISISQPLHHVETCHYLASFVRDKM